MTRRVALLLFAAWILSGCALGVSHPRALQPVEGFVPLAGDARVWVEPGYEAYGERVAQALPEAIARVEAAHYRPFVKTPRIHVCGSADCFGRYVLTPRLSAAVIPDNRLFLSPNLDGKERHRLGPLLAHELSHLHLGQRIGHYHSALPVWFHEGWASLAAEGGGAEYVSDEKVMAAIRDGRRVDLETRDTPDRRHRAAAYNLDIHSFYRQAMLLVRWLRDQDEAKFRTLVLALQDNADFVIAFADVYGSSPATHFTAFYDAVLGDNVALQAAPSTP
jgi:hypothetical protein